MPERETIQGQVVKLFSERLDLEVSSVEADLFETGILDSLKFVALLVELEQQFGTRVSLDDLELDNFRTIHKITEFLASQAGPKLTA